MLNSEAETRSEMNTRNSEGEFRVFVSEERLVFVQFEE